jgi:glycosyl hydrolase family 16
MLRRRLPHLAVLLALCVAGGASAKPDRVAQHGAAASGVTFVAPKAGARVSGTVRVRVRAPGRTDWVEVDACNGVNVGEDILKDSDGGWSVVWNTRMKGCANGTRSLNAYAFTSGGDQVGDADINVRIKNAPRPRSAPRRVKVGACRAGTRPVPIRHQGYTQKFGDCFTVLNRRVWCSHEWWQPRPPPGTQYVKNGVLHLTRRRSDGYQDNTLSSEPCGQANSKSYTFGYFEARLRWTGVPGSGPAFWLFSTRHATNPAWPKVNPYCAKHGLPAAKCWSAELDVFEGYGNHLNVFTGTVHRNSSNDYGVEDDQNGNSWQPTRRWPNLAAKWHVYAAKWTEKTITWYVDGRRIMSAPVYDSTNQPMHLLFYNWNTDWEEGNHTGPSSPPTIQTEVDWVRVWQR